MVAIKNINEDLQKEREKCTFNIEELTYFIDGSKEETIERRRKEQIVLSHKELRDDIPEEYLSHKERYENSIRKAVVFFRILQSFDTPNQSEIQRVRNKHKNTIMHAVFKDNSPLTLHNSMFIPAIEGQGTAEQRKYWLKRANNLEIIGTYAQTEMGHGTFLRGLETTATYDPTTEEFILNSPTLTSYKWWPGSLGHTVNYCVVMAQLFIKGKNHGIQPFMVQIRDEETHLPLPGIKVGEIGAKLGFNDVNNGFLGFENHRIPRDRMLMKNAQVLKDGTFKSSPNSKLAYGTMILIRVMIVNSMAHYTAKASTIATRYSAVRRQSQIKPNEPEIQILDFLTQQHKLFINIATSHAFRHSAQWLWNKYYNNLNDLNSGKFDDLPELHSVACCLKAVTTADASLAVEKCRLACGGHGYMLSSNLPYIYGLTTAPCTYEGENTVLLLQTARYLVKAYNNAITGKPLAQSVKYLSARAGQDKWMNTTAGIVNGFQTIAFGKIKAAFTELQNRIKQGLVYEDAWNQVSVRLVAASEAHARALILSTYKYEVETSVRSLSLPLREVLYQLMELYCIYWALEKSGDLLTYTTISGHDLADLQMRYEYLLSKIRPNAVGLVDAFDICDEILNSTLGAYDGRVYERLMEEAMKSPLNKEPVNESFHKYLKPMMQGKL